MLNLLAFDYGASSGRAILGRFDGGRLSLEELHRFSNDPVNINGSLFWDVLRLFHELKTGMDKCRKTVPGGIASIGIDTWGVDFGLLDSCGNLLENPYHYRDKRTEGMFEAAFKLVPKDEIYNHTGIQFMWFNTLYQLLSMRLNGSVALDRASTLLLMPDLLNYFLTGIKSTEYTNATTTQLFNPVEGRWSYELMDKLNLPAGIFTNIVNAGAILGNVSAGIQDELRTGPVPVISVASHDTGSAVASIPGLDSSSAYISCGTWSLMGVEIGKPVINERSLSLSYTNEGGVNGTIRFLKNVMGLWLLQESKRQWDREGEKLSYDELDQLCIASEPFRSFIDPDHISFAPPGNMPARIRDYCTRTGQPVPQGKGEVVRCILQSLALKYRHTLEGLEEILGSKLSVIRMVGGGIKTRILSQYTADCTNRDVAAGPVEATAIGNLAVQAMALKELGSLSEARELVGRSFPCEYFSPKDTGAWDEAYVRFRKLVDK